MEAATDTVRRSLEADSTVQPYLGLDILLDLRVALNLYFPGQWRSLTDRQQTVNNERPISTHIVYLIQRLLHAVNSSILV